jgi:hypothetical protein
MSTRQTTAAPFTAQAFATFWADPKAEYVTPDPFVPDVVGFWPDTTLHGVEDYTARLKNLLTKLPDMYLSLAEFADNGEYIFVRWVMHAAGPNGRFEMPGVDRIRVKDGLVAENLILFDTRRFEELSGLTLAEL